MALGGDVAEDARETRSVRGGPETGGGTWVMESPKSSTRGQSRELPQPNPSQSAISPRPGGGAGRISGAGRAAPAQSGVLPVCIPDPRCPRAPGAGLLWRPPAVSKAGDICCLLQSACSPFTKARSPAFVRCGLFIPNLSWHDLGAPTNPQGREARPKGRTCPPPGRCRRSASQVLPFTDSPVPAFQQMVVSEKAGGQEALPV